MAEEFQAGVCGGLWWNSPRSSLGLSPCSAAINDMGSFEWPSDMKARSSSTDHVSGPVSDELLVFRDLQKPQQPDSGDDGVLMDSTLQMMGIGLSSSSSSTSTTDWNQTLLGSGRSESNYHSSSMQQEEMNSKLNLNFWEETGQDSTANEFKPMNQGLKSATTSQGGLPTSFPMESASYGYPSTLLQTLFDTDSPPHQSLFDNRSMNYPSTTNYQTNFNEISPSLANLSPLQRQQQPICPLNLTNSTRLWNSSTEALNDIRASFFPSTQTQFLASNFEEKPRFPNLIAMPNNEVVQDSGSVAKKSSSEPAFKRPRIETPSPLPTFKVRKEKLGDRVTALQQLVSPFGKTDTASVLHEAIEYIKLLHNQVSVLSTPYMKNGAPIQHQQKCDKVKDPEGPKQDLRTRGLCLVPMSSTFPIANETTADFWAPTIFGRTFR